MKRLFPLLAVVVLLAVVALLPGCTTAELQTTADGAVHMKYRNGIFQKTIGEFSMDKDGAVHLKGVQSEATTLVKATAEGVTSGLSKVIVP